MKLEYTHQPSPVRHVRRKNSAGFDGGLSGGVSVRRPVSEDPHRRQRIFCGYVKWMMYWIVFALFTSVDTFTDFFFSFWFPFNYEIKIIPLIWLLSPATKRSSLLYRKFVRPRSQGAGD